MNIINYLIIIILSFYIITNSHIIPNKLFNNNLFKIIILFIMIIINKPIISLLIGISYIITLQNVNESFNCLCGFKNPNDKNKEII